MYEFNNSQVIKFMIGSTGFNLVFLRLMHAKFLEHSGHDKLVGENLSSYKFTIEIELGTVA